MRDDDERITAFDCRHGAEDVLHLPALYAVLSKDLPEDTQISVLTRSAMYEIEIDLTGTRAQVFVVDVNITSSMSVA